MGTPLIFEFSLPAMALFLVAFFSPCLSVSYSPHPLTCHFLVDPFIEALIFFYRLHFSLVSMGTETKMEMETTYSRLPTGTCILYIQCSSRERLKFRKLLGFIQQVLCERAAGLDQAVAYNTTFLHAALSTLGGKKAGKHLWERLRAEILARQPPAFLGTVPCC